MTVEIKTINKEITYLTREGKEETILVESALFLGTESITIATQLLKYITPFLKALGGIDKLTNNTAKKEERSEENFLEDLDITPQFFDTITEQMIISLDDRKILELIFKLVRGTRVNSQEISKKEIFDLVFQGRINLLGKVLSFIIVENFYCFFATSGFQKILARIFPITAK